jgi:ATP-dependent Lon protease
MTELSNKVKRYFGDYAVDKKLAYELELAKLPRYVAEYLISEFKHEGSGWEEKLRNYIKQHYYEPEEKELVKHRLITDGTVSIIDELRVVVDIETDTHVGIIQSHDILAEVPLSIVERNKATLVTGMWGLIQLTKSPTIKYIFEQPVGAIVEKFTPFQAPDTDPDILAEARPYFSLEEWIDVLINTIGLEPRVYSPRQKHILLTRLIPIVEGNTNISEFGPRQTGKTYLYRNLSNYVRIISGGNITPAALFYNLRTRTPGELAVKDTVVFDEISKVRFSNPDEMMGKIKDYMESGHYERGIKKVVSDSSLVFMGNVAVETASEGYIPIEDLTYVLPEAMRDSAFIDRIHGLIPGWELPKISQSKYHLKRIRHSLRLLRRSTTHNEKRNTNTPRLQTPRTLRQLQDKRRKKRKTHPKRTNQTPIPRRNLQHTRAKNNHRHSRRIQAESKGLATQNSARRVPKRKTHSTSKTIDPTKD